MHQSNPPHTQKRVTVPVSLDVLQAFQELASVSGVSTGKAMGDWLADTLDGVSLMTDLLRKAKEAPRLAALEIQAYGRGISGLADDILHDLRAKSSGASAASEVGGAPPAGRHRAQVQRTHHLVRYPGSHEVKGVGSVAWRCYRHPLPPLQ